MLLFFFETKRRLTVQRKGLLFPLLFVSVVTLIVLLLFLGPNIICDIFLDMFTFFTLFTFPFF